MKPTRKQVHSGHVKHIMTQRMTRQHSDTREREREREGERKRAGGGGDRTETTSIMNKTKRGQK